MFATVPLCFFPRLVDRILRVEALYNYASRLYVLAKSKLISSFSQTRKALVRHCIVKLSQNNVTLKQIQLNRAHMVIIIRRIHRLH